MGIGRFYMLQADLDAKYAQQRRTLNETVTALNAVCLEVLANPGALLPAIIPAIDAAMNLKCTQSERRLEEALAPLGWTMDELVATVQHAALADLAARANAAA